MCIITVVSETERSGAVHSDSEVRGSCLTACVCVQCEASAFKSALGFESDLSEVQSIRRTTGGGDDASSRISAEKKRLESQWTCSGWTFQTVHDTSVGVPYSVNHSDH